MPSPRHRPPRDACGHPRPRAMRRECCAGQDSRDQRGWGPASSTRRCRRASDLLNATPKVNGLSPKRCAANSSVPLRSDNARLDWTPCHAYRRNRRRSFAEGVVLAGPMSTSWVLSTSDTCIPCHSRINSFADQEKSFSASGKRPDFDVPEGDRKLLVLESDIAVRKFRVAHVQRCLAVQDDDEVIAVGGHLKVVPVIRLECVVTRGLRGSDDGASVVSGGLLLLDLHFVAAGLFLGDRTNTPLFAVSDVLNSSERTKFLKLLSEFR